MDYILDTLQMEFLQLEQTLSMKDHDDDDNGIDKLVDWILLELERIQFPLEYTWFGIATHLMAVQNHHPELQQLVHIEQSSSKQKLMIIDAMAKILQSKPLYNALQQQQQAYYYEQEQELKQDNDNIHNNSFFRIQQKRRAVEIRLRSMRHGGVELNNNFKNKERLKHIQMQLATLSTKFSNNLNQETKAFGGINIYNSKSLKGVPESIKSLWHDTYRQSTTESTNIKNNNNNQGLGYWGWGTNGPMSYEEALYEEEYGNFGWTMGPWRITLDQPSYYWAAMKHIPDRTVRKQIYQAYNQRCASYHPHDDYSNNNNNNENNNNYNRSNLPVIQEILQLRHEMANILGYNNYVEFSLSSKMASSRNEISKLVNLVAQKAIPAAQRELDEITAFAREQGNAAGDDNDDDDSMILLEPWDIPYWTERLKESKFQLTEEEIRPYFAFPNVVYGLFQLVYRLFGVSIQQGVADTWHPDVLFYNVYEAKEGKEQQEHIASFYLDPYARPSNKRGGAWMSSCLGKSSIVDIPVAYVTCNFDPPSQKKPSLLTFREVQSLFHEFGHALQHMLTKATIGDVSGINGIEWDAVEVPSQFMERWCYDKVTLYSFAKHWQTHRPMPEDLYHKICQQKTFQAGMNTCKQLYLGQLDLELHDHSSNSSSKTVEEILDIQRQVAQTYLPHLEKKNNNNKEKSDYDGSLCSFWHIFAGGGDGSYAAGYYSYLWSEVMSADAFAYYNNNVDSPMENAVPQSMTFRDTFLGLGGGLPPDQVFELFRGRPPTPNALLRDLGLD